MNSIEQHIINKILSLKVDTNPFDHLFLENIFPEDFYSDFVNNLPNIKEYERITDTNTVSKNYSSERHIINFQKDLSFQNKEFTKIYNLLSTVLTSKKIFEAVTSVFINVINKRIKNFSTKEITKFGSDNFKFDLRAALVKDLTKYSLGAHTDSISKYMTFLFYLPKDNTIENIGTSLFMPKKNKINYEFGSQHYSKEETEKLFDEVKSCPFRKNSVLIFPRQNMSFHGVNSVNIDKKERNLLLLNYYFRKK